MYDTDYDWNVASRLSERHPYIQMDSGQYSMDSLIQKSRIYISTYNATTYLESFSMNMPTVIFWKPEHWELRDLAVSSFEELERVNIFHKTPESAASHIERIWDNVDLWWNDADTQNAVKNFCNSYCNIKDHPIDKLQNCIKNLN